MHRFWIDLYLWKKCLTRDLHHMGGSIDCDSEATGKQLANNFWVALVGVASLPALNAKIWKSSQPRRSMIMRAFIADDIFSIQALTSTSLLQDIWSVSELFREIHFVTFFHSNVFETSQNTTRKNNNVSIKKTNWKRNIVIHVKHKKYHWEILVCLSLYW